MITLEEALVVRVDADSTLAGLIGTRRYWGIAPQNAPFPRVVMTVISDMRDQHMTGFNSLWETRVQIDAYAETRMEAMALREALIAALIPDAILTGHRFDRAHINFITDRGEDITTKYVHRQLLDISFWHGTTEETT